MASPFAQSLARVGCPTAGPEIHEGVWRGRGGVEIVPPEKQRGPTGLLGRYFASRWTHECVEVTPYRLLLEGSAESRHRLAEIRVGPLQPRRSRRDPLPVGEGRDALRVAVGTDGLGELLVGLVGVPFAERREVAPPEGVLPARPRCRPRTGEGDARLFALEEGARGDVAETGVARVLDPLPCENSARTASSPHPVDSRTMSSLSKEAAAC